ncbi:hypothetical protein ABID82_006545 [Methylobacterium sp. PvP062]|uniref:IS630 family transposase n=1 Tax=Methylobacterium radiotolerans TaxID=31998 RepID=A0ABV2NTN3_9HYPH|nr:hypothetical protein [Methylobacterium sp. PvP105]MBP2505527.1 hypothetical protein [Methylobacterium sp. PvP109]
MDPRRHTAVLSLDDKTQIQALERTRPVRRVRPSCPKTQKHDYVRHGRTTLFAALDVVDRNVVGGCTQRHRQGAAVPASKGIHAILDNHATHKHPEVRASLA